MQDSRELRDQRNALLAAFLDDHQVRLMELYQQLREIDDAITIAQKREKQAEAIRRREEKSEQARQRTLSAAAEKERELEEKTKRALEAELNKRRVRLTKQAEQMAYQNAMSATNRRFDARRQASASSSNPKVAVRPASYGQRTVFHSVPSGPQCFAVKSDWELVLLSEARGRLHLRPCKTCYPDGL